MAKSQPLEEFLIWFDVTETIIIESYTVNEYDEVDSLTFPWGETIRRCD